MDPSPLAPFVPVLVEATKFVFLELGKILDHARRAGIKMSHPVSNEQNGGYSQVLTYREFQSLETDPNRLITSIQIKQAETTAYEIESLLQQIQTHRKNFIDNENILTEMGVLAPPYVKRAMERDTDAIQQKSLRLKALLESVYGKRLVDAN